MQLGMARWKLGCAAVLTAGLWCWAASDGRLHWDEPGYLYTAAFFDTSEIVGGEFQPSGNVGFSSARILHILFAHALYSVFGVGPLVVGLITGVYTALVIGALGVAALVLRSLGRSDCWIFVAMALTMFAPVFLWLSFKTMPEAPALFLACVSVLGLLRSLKRPPVPWLVIGAASLAGMALFKATLAPMFASFTLALLLFGGHGFPFRRILVNGFIIGAGSLAMFGAFLGIVGIPLDQYLASWGAVSSQNDPLAARLAFTLLGAGLLSATLPLALLAPARRHTYFMLTWFLLSSLPFPVLLPHVEARFLLSNLIPLVGLVALSLRGLEPHMRRWWRSPLGRASMATAVATLVLSGTLAQSIMAHEVESGAIRRVITDLDRRFGRGEYSVVVPWMYTDFHYLRVVYPELDVYSVFTSGRDALSPSWQRRYYGPRAIVSLGDLQRLRQPIVYLGFEETMPIANFRRLMQTLPLDGLAEWADEKIAQLSDGSHFQACGYSLYSSPYYRLWWRFFFRPRIPLTIAA